MMSAEGAPVPVLIGPVACVGCSAGSPPGPGLATIQDRSLARVMAGGYSSASEKGRATLGRKVAAVVRDRCRIDVRVSKLQAHAVGVFALFFGMTSVEVQVEAMATLVPNGSCKPNP